jgi:hypothetical protein
MLYAELVFFFVKRTSKKNQFVHFDFLQRAKVTKTLLKMITK